MLQYFLMIRAYSLGCMSAFFFEKRSKPYIWYGAVSIANENALRRQELMRRILLRRMAGGSGE